MYSNNNTNNSNLAREQEVTEAARLAAIREKEGWKDAATLASQKKDEAALIARQKELDAQNLKLQAKQKSHEASEARSQADTLAGHEADLHAKAASSGQSPGLMDRVKAGFHNLKEKVTGHEKSSHHGDTYDTTKGHQTAEDAAQARTEAKARQLDLQLKESERQSQLNSGVPNLNDGTQVSSGPITYSSTSSVPTGYSSTTFSTTSTTAPTSFSSSSSSTYSSGSGSTQYSGPMKPTDVPAPGFKEQAAREAAHVATRTAEAAREVELNARQARLETAKEREMQKK